MKFIDKLERKFGNRGIENLTIYIIVSYVLGYALMFLNPELLSMLTLNVTQILHGQIWRLITWVIYPPTTTNLFLFIIVIVCFYYPVSSSLEHTWGSFKFTLYILSGILFTVISAFILYFITGGASDVLNGQPFTTYYISLSVFFGICDDISGDEDLVIFCDSYKNEMDGTFLCPDCWMERCKLCYERSMVYGSANRCILTELYYFLPGNKKS